MKKPDVSQLRHLANDHVFKWFFNQITTRYTPPKPSYCYKSLEIQHRIAGNQEVIETMHSLLNDLPHRESE